MQPAEVVIEARGLRMRYGTRDVLNGIDLDLHRGEVVCLLGPNGAGKTTMIEIFEGFRIPSAGDVRVLGTVPSRAGPDWKARTGIVLQSWRDHPRWTPRRLLTHLGAYYEPYGTAEYPRPYPVEDLLGTVGLTELADRKINTFSGGERRRLDVAVGIVGRPELLFLDEPTAGFDPHARRDFHQLVKRLAENESTTIMLTTHDLDEAERLADRILILAGGRIVADGSPADLAEQVAGESEVTWSRDGERHRHSTPDAVGFLRELLADPGQAVTELEVRRTSVEDSYLILVQHQESGASADDTEAIQRFERTAR